MRDTYLTFTFPNSRSLFGPPERSLESIDFSCSFFKVIMRAVEPAGDGIVSNLLQPAEDPDLSK